jgi:hypothetical protein
VQEATGTIYIGESGLGGRGSEYSMCWSARGYRHYLYRWEGGGVNTVCAGVQEATGTHLAS